MANALSSTESIAGTLQTRASTNGTVNAAEIIGGDILDNSSVDAILTDSGTVSGETSSEDTWSMSVTPTSTLAANLTLPETRAGGTNDYEELINKPKINSVTLIRNKSFEDLGLSGLSNLELESLLQ